MKLPLLLALTACGGSWTPTDTLDITNSARTELATIDECTPPSPCDPSRVRALERSSFCSESSPLMRHGQVPPDGGIACPPRK
jgi:hypothetical protein